MRRKRKRQTRAMESFVTCECTVEEAQEDWTILTNCKHSPQAPSNMFFQHNTALTAPYSVLVDTNFLSHTVHHKLPLLPTLMDTLYATCTPIITSCVMVRNRRANLSAYRSRVRGLEGLSQTGCYISQSRLERESETRCYSRTQFCAVVVKA